ncbi:MAG: hypothetical protein ACE5FN_02155 [Leptospirillia bacterium]
MDKPELEIADAESFSRGGQWIVPLGIAAGAVVYFVLSRLFGVHIEVWEGITTFNNLSWFGAVAVAPALSGFITGIICGHNGKWYALLPVTVLHTIEYIQLRQLPLMDVDVLGFGIFIFLMIVMMELALMGGWGAEILRLRMADKGVRA